MNTLSAKSILVVDDDPAMRRALARVLGAEGAAVSQAGSGADALEQIVQRRVPFDLVITDLKMPAVDGTAVLDAVHLALPNAPVIIVTAFGSPDLEAQCRRLGVAAFLEKPVETETLLAAIDHAFSRSAGAEPLAHRGAATGERE